MTALSTTPLRTDCTLVRDFSRNWIWLMVRGVLAVVFAVFAFRHPLVAGLSLTMIWGVFAFSEGGVALITAFRVRKAGRPIWPMVLMGVLGVLAGLMALLAPGMTVVALMLLMGAWAVVIGGLLVVTAVWLRDEIEGEWFLGLAGLFSVLFGLVLCGFPEGAAVALIWSVAAPALLFGVLLILFAFRVRRLGRSLEASSSLHS